ncbi:hypothetical protein [Novosphingobium fuchskuhlense]|uniref:hypothetical protein n=1 Tax=Novosphingobium fuchskuhlense TaxID=1117702 RepID=UPI00146FCF7C|nr:hypothetical protein [Novosphingobium fuchskuhlense]
MAFNAKAAPPRNRMRNLRKQSILTCFVISIFAPILQICVNIFVVKIISARSSDLTDGEFHFVLRTRAGLYVLHFWHTPTMRFGALPLGATQHPQLSDTAPCQTVSSRDVISKDTAMPLGHNFDITGVA